MVLMSVLVVIVFVVLAVELQTCEIQHCFVVLAVELQTCEVQHLLDNCRTNCVTEKKIR